MNRVIFYGGVRSYTTADGAVNYCAEYLSEEGIAHRDRINVTVYNTIKQKNVAPGTMIEGVFEVDSFNSIRLCDLIV